MSLRVIGAGLGRTGTYSLKVALEQLLGAPCYHMAEVFQRPQDVPVWRAAAKGDSVDWHALMSGYKAAVDWPVSAFWPQVAEAFPEATILLSVRDSGEWWESASQTIFADPNFDHVKGQMPDWVEMIKEVLAATFISELGDKKAAVAAFERHNSNVLDTAPRGRLVVWQASDGWGPLCQALDVPVPSEPFPKVNTKEEFMARIAAK